MLECLSIHPMHPVFCLHRLIPPIGDKNLLIVLFPANTWSYALISACFDDVQGMGRCQKS